MNLENSSLRATKCLKRSSLAPNQVTNLVHRYSKILKDTERWYVDWKLLDAFKGIWSKSHWDECVEQLREAAKDKSLTKQFYHYDATVGNFYHFLDQTVERPDFRYNENFKVATTYLRRMLKICNLQPAKLESVDDLENIWTNKSSSAGAIGMGTKDANKLECFEAAMRIKGKIKTGVPFSEIWIPCTVGHRSQLGGLVKDGKYSGSFKMKDRLVFVSDGGSVTVEGQYAKPLIKYLSSSWYGYSGGDKPTELREKIYTSKIDKYFVSTDYEKFDQCIQSWLIKECFSIIKEFFDVKYHKEIDWICYNFINTWIILPGCDILQKHRGIPSGSNFTQVVGSMANALMMLTYLSSRCKVGSISEKLSYVESELSQNYHVNHYDTMFIMGDDNLCFTKTKIDLDSMSKYVWRFFGVKINVEKTVTSDMVKEPEYLKREWRYGGEYRDILELAINMTHPEHNRDYDTYSEWHIMYGIFLTYTKSFPNWVTERYLIEKMNTFGGVERLLSVNPKDLPGSLRVFGDNARYFMYHRAKAVLASSAA